MFGEFHCGHCSRNWFSGNAWKGMGQECLKCKRMCLPKSLRPLQHRLDPDEQQSAGPHLQERCQMCKKLGRNCRGLSEVEREEVDDDESVFSEYSTTSDSSAASAPDLQDLEGDVTPVGSDDEATEDLLARQLEKLYLKRK